MLEKEVFEAYCREYYNPIFKFCMSRLNDKHDAEDATQETFAVFSEKGHLLEEQHIKAWLFATAHNFILREYKRRGREKQKSEKLNEEISLISKKVTHMEEQMIDYYMEKYIDDIYVRLSEKEKKLFDLFSNDNLKTGDFAEILGIEAHACSMRKKRLKEKCKAIMEEILFF